MMKKLSCRDVGMDCDFTVCAKTEEELFRKGSEHGRTVHNMTEISKETEDKIRSAIREVEKC